MGLRVRLKASVNINGFSPDVQVLLTALKHYGMILADNGTSWYISGAPDSRFNDSDFHTINQITDADFEVVDTSGLVNGPDPATPTATITGNTPTQTPQPPTASATSTPVPPSATATRTPVPPTATSTATTVKASSTPTRAPTASVTPTGVPPSATSSPTATMRATATATGVAATASSTPVTPRTIVLTPVADAYVRDGADAGTNYGTAKSLMAKWWSSTGYNRLTYLRFDLHGVSGTIRAATLRLYGQHVATGTWNGTESVFPVISTTWIESGTGGITWNTRPAAGQTALASIRVGETLQYYGWNTGSYVASQQAKPGLVSFVLAMNARNADGHVDSFNSRNQRQPAAARTHRAVRR